MSYGNSGNYIPLYHWSFNWITQTISIIPLVVIYLCESQTVVISGQHLCANVVPIVDISADHKWSHTYVCLLFSGQSCHNR